MKSTEDFPNSLQGKYALINFGKLANRELIKTKADLIAALIRYPDAIEFGEVGSPDEFFVLKLKDINSPVALGAYARSISHRDPEFAGKVAELANRAGTMSQFCKNPD